MLFSYIFLCDDLPIYKTCFDIFIVILFYCYYHLLLLFFYYYYSNNNYYYYYYYTYIYNIFVHRGHSRAAEYHVESQIVCVGFSPCGAYAFSGDMDAQINAPQQLNRWKNH